MKPTLSLFVIYLSVSVASHAHAFDQTLVKEWRHTLHKLRNDPMDQQLQHRMENPVLWKTVGEEKFRNNEYPDANTSLSHAIRYRKGDQDAWCMLAKSLDKQNDKKGANIAYRHKYHLSGSSEDFHKTAKSLFKNGDIRECHSFLEKNIAKHKHDYRNWKLLGHCYHHAGYHEEAKRAYRQSHEINPNDQEVKDILGIKAPEPAHPDINMKKMSSLLGKINLLNRNRPTAAPMPNKNAVVATLPKPQILIEGGGLKSLSRAVRNRYQLGDHHDLIPLEANYDLSLDTPASMKKYAPTETKVLHSSQVIKATGVTPAPATKPAPKKPSLNSLKSKSSLPDL